MIRARTLLHAGTWDMATAADRVVLPHDGRYQRRIAMRGEGDAAFLLDLAEDARLRNGDGLQLEDGRVVAVIAAQEPVAEIIAHDPLHLARLAWHLGSRHVPAELLADRIRIARDGALEEVVRGLGASVEVREAAFEPEALTGEAHGHSSHAHVQHDHVHDANCGCGHDHDEHHGHEHHGHAHHAHSHAAPVRDVLHVHSEGTSHDHGHEHACGCGHDHHDDHGHKHDHSHTHHGHGSRKG